MQRNVHWIIENSLINNPPLRFTEDKNIRSEFLVIDRLESELTVNGKKIAKFIK